MIKTSTLRFHIALLLFVGGFVVVSKLDMLWSNSVDLAHHYALAFRIGEQWILDSANDPSLGEMNFYPNLSHTIAAMLGWIVNSTFLGMQLVALVSLAVLWIAILAVINSLPARAGLIGSVVLCLLVIFSSRYVKLDLHGAEIVGNYFFSQLVGQSVLFATMAIAIFIEQKRGLTPALLFLLLGTIVNTSLHLLPALEMAGFFCALVVVNFFFEQNAPRSRVRQLLLSALLLLVVILSILLNPSFSAMRKISENNGALALHHISYPYGIFALCLGSVGLALCLFFIWKNRPQRERLSCAALKYLATYGLAIAGLCLLQYAFAGLGFGSDYAVKKYGFGLESFLAVALSALSGVAIARYLKVGNPYKEDRAIYTGMIVQTIVFYFIFSYSLPSKKLLDVSEIVMLERQLIELRDVAVPTPRPGTSNVVIDLNHSSSLLDYMFSIAMLKTDRNVAVPDVLVANQLSDLGKYSYVLSGSSSKLVGATHCKSLSSGEIAIVEASCIMEQNAAASICSGRFDLSSNGSVPSNMVSGFGKPEIHGRWTDGKSARFSCVAKKDSPARMKIVLSPFVHANHDLQRLAVRVNGVPAYRSEFTAADANKQIDISLPEVGRNDRLVVEFDVPDAISPKAIGFNDDERELGFLFESVTFE